MAKKEIDFGSAKTVEPVRQEEKINGQVGEKLVWTSVDIDSDLYRRLKISLTEKGVSIKDFMHYWIDRASQDKLPKPLPKENKAKSSTKKTFQISESARTKLKKWLISNDETMRNLIEFGISQELKQNKNA